MQRMIVSVLAILLIVSGVTHAQRYTGPDGRLRVALAKQPFSPTGTSAGPNTMANGGIQQILANLDVVVRIEEAVLTPEEATEYGAWKRLGMALGHFADIVAANERDGYFTVGLLATCPSMPGLVAGLQHSGPRRQPLKIGMLWLDAHPDFNTPETTRSGYSQFLQLGTSQVKLAETGHLESIGLCKEVRKGDSHCGLHHSN